AEDDAASQRMLLDTVLGTAALCAGYEGLHAAAVELAGGVVAIAAPTGAGKSTLCAELVARGARLFTDDLLFLARDGRGVVAHPGPPLMSVPQGSARRAGPWRPLAALGDEVWVKVSDASSSPARVATLIVLDR